MSRYFLSIIVPFYNESGNLPKLHQEIIQVCSRLKQPIEIIYVDDCSTDNSQAVLSSILKKKKNSVSVRILSFKKNFGQTAAMVAGIESARGQLVTFLDSDMQNDPADIPRMLELIGEGHDVVFGWRKHRQDQWLRVAASNAGNWLIRRFFAIPLHDAGCTLKMCRKELFLNLHFYGEAHRIMSVALYNNSVSSTEIVVNHRPRLTGYSKYNYFRIFKLIIDLITAKFLNEYTTKPAYVFGFPGIICNTVGILLLVIAIFNKQLLGTVVQTEIVLIAALLLILIGMQFIFFGLLAEIQIRIYFETQNKKIYQIKKILEF